MKVKIISFYTTGPYAELALKLTRSCDQFNLAYEVCGRGPFGSWAEAVVHKPKFIADMLEATSGYDGLLWVDADAVFKRSPDWSALEGADVAWCRWQRTPNHGVESLTGTMYFACTPAVRELAMEWALATPRHREHFTPEQAALQEIWPRYAEALRYVILPHEWCFIYDDMRQLYPQAQPVIEHYQASRQYRYASQPVTKGAP